LAEKLLMDYKILLVEDSKHIQHLVPVALGKDFDVAIAGCAEEAFKMVESSNFDLILLDVQLPDMDGFQICSLLRNKDKTSEVPIIFLTGKKEVSDKVMGFSLGADDYIVKPFEPLEFKARVESRLKRDKSRQKAEETIHKGDLKMNIPKQTAWVKDEELDLTPLEFKLLLYFVKHEDHVLSRNQILNKVWGEGVFVIDRTVDMHISNLKKKLASMAKVIKSIHGEGYKFSLKLLKKKAS